MVSIGLMTQHMSTAWWAAALSGNFIGVGLRCGHCVPCRQVAGHASRIGSGLQTCMLADLQVHSLAPPGADACRLGDRGLHLLGTAVVEHNLGVLQTG